MPLSPTSIRRKTDRLSVTWSDGVLSEIPSRTLRINCPCATCKEARGDTSHAKPLSPKKSMLKVIDASAEQETALQEVWAVGQYAIGLRWSDGHQTGIYTYDYLRSLVL